MTKRLMMITGASSGIGEAFAREYAKRGWDLVLTARREERLSALASELQDQHRIVAHVLPGDLAEVQTPAALLKSLADQSLVPTGFVNNAGYGIPGYFEASDWKAHQDFLQVLLVSGVQLTHGLLPGMRAEGFGRMIHVASIAGMMPSAPGYTLYAPIKAAVRRFSETLWMELKDTGIHVTALCPGLTESEFFDRPTDFRDPTSIPKFLWMDAATVVAQGADACEANKPVLVNGVANQVATSVLRATPSPVTRFLSNRFASKFRKPEAG